MSTETFGSAFDQFELVFWVNKFRYDLRQMASGTQEAIPDFPETNSSTLETISNNLSGGWVMKADKEYYLCKNL